MDSQVWLWQQINLLDYKNADFQALPLESESVI